MKERTKKKTNRKDTEIEKIEKQPRVKSEKREKGETNREPVNANASTLCLVFIRAVYESGLGDLVIRVHWQILGEIEDS